MDPKLESYLRATRVLRPERVKPRGHDLFRVALSRYFPGLIPPENLVLTHSTHRSCESVEIAGQRYVVYDTYMTDSLHILNSLWLINSSVAEYWCYALRVIAEKFLQRDVVSLGAYAALHYRLAATFADPRVSRINPPGIRGFFTATQETFVVLHELSHIYVQSNSAEAQAKIQSELEYIENCNLTYVAPQLLRRELTGGRKAALAVEMACDDLAANRAFDLMADDCAEGFEPLGIVLPILVGHYNLRWLAMLDGLVSGFLQADLSGVAEQSTVEMMIRSHKAHANSYLILANRNVALSDREVRDGSSAERYPGYQFNAKELVELHDTIIDQFYESPWTSVERIHAFLKLLQSEDWHADLLAMASRFDVLSHTTSEEDLAWIANSILDGHL